MVNYREDDASVNDGPVSRRSAHNGAFVQLPPTHRPTSVGFFVPAGHQKGVDWSTSALVRGFTRNPPYERATSLPVEKFQRGTLRIFASAKILAAGNALT